MGRNLNLSQSTQLLSRIVAAIFGGYLLTNCLAILLSYILPMPKVDAVFVGILASFLIYISAIVWVFSAKTVSKAWLGLLVPGIVGAVIIYFLQPEGLLL